MNQGQLEASLTSLSPPSFRIQKLRRDTSANILEMTEKSVRTLLTFSTTFRHGVLKWILYTLRHLSLTTISSRTHNDLDCILFGLKVRHWVNDDPAPNRSSND